jgi:hypothetical protein
MVDDDEYEHGMRIVEAKDATEAEAIINYHVGVDDPYGISKRVDNFYAYGILMAVPGMLKTSKD